MSGYVSLLRAPSSAVSTTLELRPFRSGLRLVPSCLKLRSSRWPAALTTICHRQDCYGATTATPRASPPPMYATAHEDNCSDTYVNKLQKHDLNHVQTIISSSGRWLPLSCMILVELINSGTILLGKVSVDQGIFVFALLCYRSSLGAIFTFPFALLLERDKWKKMNWAGFKWIFLTIYTTHGYVLIWLEGHNCLLRCNFLRFDPARHVHPISDFQWKLHELYPCKLWSTFFTCVLGGIQTLIVGIAMRRDPFAWKLGWNVHLLTVLYSAVLGMATKYFLNLYVVSKRGPAYASMFSSLSVIFTLFGSLILGETVTVGSLSSATMVIIGLSLYLYGKAKDGSSSECSTGIE